MVGSKSLIAVVVVLFSVTLLGQHVEGEVHHMVGDDHGWDSSINLTTWSNGRLFRHGDIIWFTYTAPEESVVELETIGEFSSCDLTNPIKMYTEGLDKVQLDDEGSRFFASGNIESCKKGLKIHVNVHPKENNETHHDEPSSSSEAKDDDYHHDEPPSPKGKDVPPPQGPIVPSGSTHLGGLGLAVLVGLLLCYLGF